MCLGMEHMEEESNNGVQKSRWCAGGWGNKEIEKHSNIGALRLQ